VKEWREHVRSVLLHYTDRPDDDVIEELAQHAADAFSAARADGMAGDEARTRVARDVQQWCEARAVQRRRPSRPGVVVPPASRSRGLAGVGQDLRYGLRLLAAHPGYTALAILTTALGVGATTTLGSIVYGVLLRPLAYPSAERLVRVVETRADTTRLLPPIMSNGPYHAWRAESSTIDGLAAFSSRVMTLTIDGHDPVRVPGTAVTASLFPLLASPPLHGTYFTEAHEADGNRSVIVLSYGLWMEQFGGRPDAIGATVTLDGQPHRVLGVAPSDFAFPDAGRRYWVPFFVPPGAENRITMFGAIARLKPGVTADQAAAEATGRALHAPALGMVGVAVFGTQSAPVIEVVPLVEFMTGDVRDAIVLLLSAVVLLFLTAVANVSSMQLAQAAGRRRELAVRAALGAGGGRLSRQPVIEGTLLGLAGGLAGVALALLLHAALPSLLPAGFPRLADIRVDAGLVAGAMAIAVAAGVAFGLLPAAQVWRLDLSRVLNDNGQAPVGVGWRSATGFMRAAIMASQIAAATVLLVGAVLLARSFAARWAIDRGYEPAHVLTAQVVMPEHAFTPVERARAVNQIIARMTGQPGVLSAGLTTVMPLVAFESLMGFEMPSRDGGAPVRAQANVRTVSPAYFQAIGARLTAGRWLRDDDGPGSRYAVLVNRSFVRAYLSGTGVGAMLPLGMGEGAEESEIVGVLEDIQPRVAGEPPRPEIFVSIAQLREGLLFESPSLVVRTSGDPAALAPALREIVRAVHPSIALESLMTMEDRLRAELAQPRLYSVLVGAFAVLALVIASAGLFGAVSYSVSRRTRELGVRAALGATPADLVRLVLRQGLAIAAAGVAIGLASAASAASLVSSLVYGVDPRDPWTFAVVPIVLVALAMLACLVPALRASRVDPLEALRRL
jgi:predicted permease